MALVFPPKLWLFSKTHSIVVSFRPQVTPRPARTYAACVSLSLSTMSISSGDHSPIPQPEAQKPPGPPLRPSSRSASLFGFSSQSGPPRRSAASLSDPAYMPPHSKLSTPENQDFQLSDKYPSYNGNIDPYCSFRNLVEVVFPRGNSSGRSKAASLLLDAHPHSL